MNRSPELWESESEYSDSRLCFLIFNFYDSEIKKIGDGFALIQSNLTTFIDFDLTSSIIIIFAARS